MNRLALLLLLVSFGSLAEQKLNPVTGKFETVRPGSKLKYNYMEEEWKYAPPDSKIQYNPLTDKYDMAPKEYVNKYNAIEGQWEKTHPDSKLKMNPTTGSKLEYNPFSNEFEYAQ
jgi:hypothetical protein